MTATDSEFDFDTIGPATPADEAPAARGRYRTGTTRRAVVISLLAGAVASFGSIGLTGSASVDSIQAFVVVAIVTFIGAHAHRWAWFAAGALLAAVVRDLPLVAVLLGLAAAVSSTRFANRAKDIGAVAVGLASVAVFWSAGHNIGWPTVPVTLVAFGVLIGSGFPNLRRRHRRRFGWLFAILAVSALLAIGAAAAALAQSAGDVNAGSTAARAALTEVRRGNNDGARDNLAVASKHLDRTEGLLGKLTLPATMVPGVAQQVTAVTTSLDQARSITTAANTLVETNYHDLRYDGAIDTRHTKYLHGPASEVAAILAEADADMTRLQDSWLLPPLEDRVDEFADNIREARADTDLAVQVLDVLPGMLGEGGVRRYAVVFITPAELRGGGGFIGSWAELLAANGKVRLTSSGRIADLISAPGALGRTLKGPEDYVSRYGRLRPEIYLQDVPYSPDWPSNAAVFRDLYLQATQRKVDGVIAVDPTGLAALLELTGPVDVEGLEIPLQSSNAVRLLTRQQYLQFADRSEREDVLAAASKATFEKLTQASLPSPERIGSVLGPAARGRHLQVWTPSKAEQALFRTVHADSALRIPKGGDGFSVVQQNLGNNKLDAYLQRKISYDVTVDASDGSLAGTMTIELQNEIQDLTYPNAVVGNRRGAPRGTNVANVSVHAPWTVLSATIDGEAETLGRGKEAGLLAWDTPVVQIPPGGKVTIVLEIQGNVDLREGLDLRVLPQPVAQTDELDLRVVIERGRFGTPEGDHGALELSANAQELRLTGRMDQIVDLQVPASR